MLLVCASHYAKWKEPRPHILWFTDIEMPQIDKTIETEMVTDCLKDTEILGGGDKNVLKSDSGHGCTTLLKCISLICTLEKGQFCGIWIIPPKIEGVIKGCLRKVGHLGPSTLHVFVCVLCIESTTLVAGKNKLKRNKVPQRVWVNSFSTPPPRSLDSPASESFCLLSSAL